jgi:hypothetical protein
LRAILFISQTSNKRQNPLEAKAPRGFLALAMLHERAVGQLRTFDFVG